jgi:hypothetical protein
MTGIEGDTIIEVQAIGSRKEKGSISKEFDRTVEVA